MAGRGDGEQEKREKVEEERDADGPTFFVFSKSVVISFRARSFRAIYTVRTDQRLQGAQSTVGDSERLTSLNRQLTMERLSLDLGPKMVELE